MTFSPSTVATITTTNIQEFLHTDAAVPHTIMFSAAWHEPCKDMQGVMAALSQTHATFYYGVCEAEENVELSEQARIESVPTFIIYRDAKEIDRVNGANAALLSERITFWDNQIKLNPNVHSLRQLEAKINVKPTQVAIEGNNKPEQSAAATSSTLTECIEALLNQSPVLLFMKGVPSAPRCGFSRQIVALLQSKNIKFESFDILTNEEIRQGLKEYSKWPTYPQLYVKGELLGGLDVVKELAESDELLEMVPSECIVQP